MPFSLITRVVIGVVDGAGGPNLKAWFEDLPHEYGKVMGKALRKLVEGQKPRSPKEQERLNQELQSLPDGGERVLQKILEKSDSLLPIYSDVLKAVIHELKENSRPFVLRGFLHSSDNLSYWEFERGKEPRIKDPEEKDGKSGIPFAYPFQIYLLPDVSPEYLDDLNRVIRHESRLALAELALGAKAFRNIFRVDRIEEFKLFGKAGSLAMGFKGPATQWTDAQPIPIPDGAPGIPSMLHSVEKARAAQKETVEALKKTMEKIKKGVGNPPL